MDKIEHTHHLHELGEGDCGTVEEFRRQPALLIVAVADSSSYSEKVNELGDRGTYSKKSKNKKGGEEEYWGEK